MLYIKYICLIIICLGVALEALYVISLASFIMRRKPIIHHVLDMVIVFLMIIMVSVILEIFPIDILSY